MPEDKPCTEKGIARAFQIAHLLTADIGQAESATIQGIESWNPNEEPAEALFHRVLSAATSPSKLSVSTSDTSNPTHSYLPIELQRVMKLPQPLRHAFVLRILSGMPPGDCAHALHLGQEEVSENLCAALRQLQTQEAEP